MGPLGGAVNDAAIRRQIRILKDMGCNAIRTSHNMPAPELVEACDEMGMLFWSEAPFWGIGGFGPDGYWNSSAYPSMTNTDPDLMPVHYSSWGR